MNEFRFRRVRRTLEPVLAVVVLASAAGWILEPAVLEGATSVTRVWLALAVLAPGLLALSVLVGALARGVRLGATRLGDADRTRAGDSAPAGVFASAVLGALAVLTLWWVAGSLAVVLTGAGGVVLAPFAALVVGSALGVLVLVRTLLDRLFPAIRDREPIAG